MNFHLFPDNAKLQFRVLTPTEVGGSDIPGNDLIAKESGYIKKNIIGYLLNARFAYTCQ